MTEENQLALPTEEGFNTDSVEQAMLDANRIPRLRWMQRNGTLIRLGDMADSHLRNTALMLMGLGYQRYHKDDAIKIKWLTALRMEWERRIATGQFIKGTKTAYSEGGRD